MNINNQLEIDRRWAAFVDLLLLMQCKRCWRGRHGFGKPYHHHGGLLRLISKASFTRNEVELWIKDPEHGLAHGICTAFLAFCLSKTDRWYSEVAQDSSFYTTDILKKGNLPPWNKRPIDAERLILSCIVHDFLKGVGGEHDDHDSLLATRFPDLDTSTYSHANPQEVTTLVAADRIELRRYTDHAEWCDESLLLPHEECIGQDLVLHFYKHLRSMIQKQVLFHNDYWVSHVSEHPPDREIHYPAKHWVPNDPGYAPQDSSKQYFSINVGKTTTGACHNHTIASMKNDALIGYITCDEIKKYGEITHAPDSCWGRDHLFFRKNYEVPTSAWVFAYGSKDYIGKLHPSASMTSLQNFRMTSQVVDGLIAIFMSLAKN